MNGIASLRKKNGAMNNEGGVFAQITSRTKTASFAADERKRVGPEDPAEKKAAQSCG
jgi:hypothetical protein